MAQTATSAENIPVSATSILALPDMVLIGIVQFLGPRDIVAFGSVCKRFMGPAAEDRLVWGPICQAIVGSAAAASPDAWHAPSFQRLYCRLLRTYGELLAGPWRGRADPLGSLLVAFPSPPYIIGGVITSLKLAEPGVTVVPVFRVSYDSVSGDASVSCLRGRNMFESLLRRLATQETQSHSGHTPSLEEEDPFGAEGVHTAELQFHFEQDAPSAAASVDGAGGSAESGPVPAQVQPPLATTEGGASDAEEGAGASTSTAATAADGNGQTGAAAAAVALQHMDRTSDDAFSASARRPHPDCLGTLGFEPRNFAFRCRCIAIPRGLATSRWLVAGLRALSLASLPQHT
ncbi:hypothetical protein Vretimale_11658 [Volvox reticuliferus]|uniref:F-box domain-containing protein n=1 Tax=Volvox reticuliferus TaxID=1737510 RepID=A0A8J4GH03_9CHLO|nr:hypothetical protein Vretifemale_14749 [Volvox reticuliferus]GIM07567.1 hypothetical protein Vretimale_11658 [Volvox reticuliferus]